MTPPSRIEAPTLLLIALCFVLWALATTALAAISLPAGIVLAAITIALHGSLCHEVIHGHPTRSERLNALLVFPALNLAIPFLRFRDTHLAHHRDERLTDPFEDPESNYVDPAFWARLPVGLQGLMRANNTLLGRLLLGPAIGQARFMAGDLAEIRAGNRRVLAAWAWHLPAVGVVLLWLSQVGAMPLWAYALAAYGGLSLLRIRTFLEHRAHHLARARTVVVEDTGPLAFLFLNNNLHVVHHMHPRVPWYRLPALYAANRAHYLRRNDGYRYRSYGEVFARHLLRAKDTVPHPLAASNVPAEEPAPALQPAYRRPDA